MKIGTEVLYFYDKIVEPTKAGVPNLAFVYKRPTSFPTVDIWLLDLKDETTQFRANTSHGQSLQECLEVGDKWISMEEAEGFGIDLEDGDQDLTEL